MSNMKYLGILCLGALIIGAASAFPSTDIAPSFSNKIESGSSLVFSIGNLNSDLGDRFIMGSANPGVSLFNNVDVTSYASDLPSKGSVSAYLKGKIMEGGREDIANQTESSRDLYEFMSFFDSTSVSGDIFSFSKHMSYSSVWG